MKKYLAAVAVLLLTAGVYAFKTPEPAKKPASLLWYSFIDIPGNSPADPNDYQLTGGTGQTEPLCQGFNRVCAVLAEPSSTDINHPNLDAVDETRMKQ